MNGNEEKERNDHDSLPVGFEIELSAPNPDSREGDPDDAKILAMIRRQFRRVIDESGAAGHPQRGEPAADTDRGKKEKANEYTKRTQERIWAGRD
jgi:hypothetical protein